MGGPLSSGRPRASTTRPMRLGPTGTCSTLPVASTSAPARSDSARSSSTALMKSGSRSSASAVMPPAMRSNSPLLTCGKPVMRATPSPTCTTVPTERVTRPTGRRSRAWFSASKTCPIARSSTGAIQLASAGRRHHCRRILFPRRHEIAGGPGQCDVFQLHFRAQEQRLVVDDLDVVLAQFPVHQPPQDETNSLRLLRAGREAEPHRHRRLRLRQPLCVLLQARRQSRDHTVAQLGAAHLPQELARHRARLPDNALLHSGCQLALFRRQLLQPALALLLGLGRRLLQQLLPQPPRLFARLAQVLLPGAFQLSPLPLVRQALLLRLGL